MISPKPIEITIKPGFPMREVLDILTIDDDLVTLTDCTSVSEIDITNAVLADLWHLTPQMDVRIQPNNQSAQIITFEQDSGTFDSNTMGLISLPTMTTTAPSAILATTIDIDPIEIEMYVGDKIAYNDKIIEIAQDVEIGDTQIVVKPLTVAVPSGEILTTGRVVLFATSTATLQCAGHSVGYSDLKLIDINGFEFWGDDPRPQFIFKIVPEGITI